MGPFACGRHANCVFGNTHHSARRSPVRRRGSHTPPRRPGGLLLFQRPSRAAGEPNQSPAQACREEELDGIAERDGLAARRKRPVESADVLADVCKSQQRARMHVCVHAFFRCTDCVCAGNVYTMQTQRTAIKMH